MSDQNLTSYGALVLRVGLGVMALTHGLLKVFVFTLPGTVQFFESLGFPGFAAYGVVTVEILGGVALIVGFHTRIAALVFVPVLLGAAWVHAGNGWLFSAQGGGWEFPIFWTLALVVQALIGDGAYALRPTTLKVATVRS